MRPWFLAVMLGAVALSTDLGADALTGAPAGPSGAFDNVTVEHNVALDGVTGMTIHATFTTFNERGRACGLVAYFMLDDGTHLVGRTPRYMAAGGQVAVWSIFTPEFDRVIFRDYMLFLPYSELNMRAGSYKLKFHLELYDQETKVFFARSRDVHFTYTGTE